MTTETIPPVVPPPVPPPVVPPPDGTAADLAAKLADANARAGQFAQQIATLTAERDGFRTQVADLTPKAARAIELEGTVATLTNDKREGAFIEALRGKLPGAEPLALRGVLGELHKAGKVNRYPEDAAAELAKALPIITAEVPSLARPLTSGGGSPGASTRIPPKAGYRGPFSK